MGLIFSRLCVWFEQDKKSLLRLCYGCMLLRLSWYLGDAVTMYSKFSGCGMKDCIQGLEISGQKRSLSLTYFMHIQKCYKPLSKISLCLTGLNYNTGGMYCNIIEKNALGLYICVIFYVQYCIPVTIGLELLTYIASVVFYLTCCIKLMYTFHVFFIFCSFLWNSYDWCSHN